MKMRSARWAVLMTAGAAILGALIGHPRVIRADSIPATMLDPNLEAQAVLTAGISQPIGIVFLSTDDYFVLEKSSGQVKRVIGGVVQASPSSTWP